MYDKLFLVEIPGKAEGTVATEDTAATADTPAVDDEDEDGEETDKVDWLSQINPDSLIIHKEALLEPGLMEFASKPLATNVQLQRLGFFTFDKDSTAEHAVLNRTVMLKESTAKAALK